MTRIEFFQVLGFFLLIFASSSLMGVSIIKLIQKFTGEKREKTLPIEHIGAGFLIGIGVIAYISMAFGVVGFFTKTTLLIVILGALAISYRELFPLMRSVVDNFKALILEYKKGLVGLIAITLSVVTLGSLYLTAMQPPYTSDELHYHLPEVRQIVSSQKIELDFGGHPFYGNIPKLMEIIFAIGKTLSSYQLSHALNFAIFLGFILVVFGFVKKYYGIAAASLSILLLVWFDDITWNATGGFIDAATTAFEISALLFILDWADKKNKASFYISAILIGIAASIKYSPLPTAVFILGIITYKLIKENGRKFIKSLKTILPYVVVAFVAGGFWYIKNLIKFGNPFYPLYFGHPGYDEAQFKSLVDAIHEFGPKNPAYFLELTKRYLTTSQFFVFISIYTTPLIPFIKRQNKFRILLFLYFTVYVLYWFLLATHQIRFLGSALVVSLIMLSITASRVKLKHYFIAAFLLLSSALLYSGAVRPINYGSIWKNFWNTKFHLIERQYALGNVTQTQFLTWQFGCQYSVIKYFEDNKLEGGVIDNWSVWFAPSVSFYAESNNFQSYQPQPSIPSSSYFKDLRAKNIKFIYLNSETKERFLKSVDPIVIQNKLSKLPAEEYLLKYASQIFKDDKCYLYKINL